MQSRCRVGRGFKIFRIQAPAAPAAIFHCQKPGICPIIPPCMRPIVHLSNKLLKAKFRLPSGALALSGGLRQTQPAPPPHFSLSWTIGMFSGVKSGSFDSSPLVATPLLFPMVKYEQDYPSLGKQSAKSALARRWAWYRSVHGRLHPYEWRCGWQVYSVSLYT